MFSLVAKYLVLAILAGTAALFLMYVVDEVRRV
jgi:hypothetical protein